MAPPALLQPAPSTSSILDAFLDRHQQLLQLEKKAEEDQTRLLNSKCLPRLLEQRGLALSGLGVSGISIGLGGKSLIELHRPLAYHTSTALPPHTFRAGDVVRIEAHVSNSGAGKGKGKKKEDEDAGAVEGVVYRVGPEKVVVAVDGSKEIDLPERLRLLKLANTITFDRMETTLDHLRRLTLPKPDTPPPRAINFSLIKALLGIEIPEWTQDVPASLSVESDGQTAEPPGSPDVKWFDRNLNDSQKEAVEFCLKAKQVACIHGPPGTGKTHTLIELIFQLLSRPASPGTTLPPRILITTPSNLALDNLLLRLHSLAQQPPYSSLLTRDSILRIGHPTRVHRDLVKETLDWRAANGEQGELLKDVGKEMQGHLSELGKKRGDKGAVRGRARGKKWDEVRELRKEYRQREGKVVKAVINAAQVVLATCHSAGSRQLNNMIFDVCIIDEATQAVEAVCWVPILKSRKLILAGDPEQLPPTIMSKGDVPPPKTVKDKPPVAPADGASRKPVGATSETVSSLESGEKGGESTLAAQEDGLAASDPLVDEVPAAEQQRAADSECSAPVSSKPLEISSPVLRDTTASTASESATHPSDTVDLPSTHLTSPLSPAPAPAPDSPDSLSTLQRPLHVLRLARSPPLHPPRTLETTLFERLETLYGSGIKRVLQIQYRMNEHIASFPSKTLYESRLLSDPSVAKRTLVELPSVQRKEEGEDDVQMDLGEPVVFFDTAGCEFYERTEGDEEGGGKRGAIGEGSKSNENEAEIVAKWARKLVTLGVPPADIGIVTPYQAQVALISSMIHDEFPEMTIGSVDGLQGQEREAIILSLVRSNAAGEVGFLGEYRRLNVAMTRAKRQLCVVGDSSTVAKGSKYLKSWMAWLEAEADVRWAGDDAV